MSLDAPSLYGFATLLLALASFMSRLSLNGTKMAAKQHQTHFLPIQQSPTKKLLPANNPGWKPWLSLSCVSLMQTVTVEELDSITSKTLRSEGVGSERDWLQRETWCLTSRGNTGQTRQIEHRCPLRLANRMCQRAAFIFSALLSLAEKIGREWMDREDLAENRWFQHILQVLTHSQALPRRWSGNQDRMLDTGQVWSAAVRSSGCVVFRGLHSVSSISVLGGMTWITFPWALIPGAI